MIIFLSIIIAIPTILLLITIHEFAHFIIAKASGAYVYEFAIGIGPKILAWQRKETRYTLRLLPLGGYVSLASEELDPPKYAENIKVEKSQMIENLPRLKKAGFISSGSIMNLILAILLLMFAYTIFPYHRYSDSSVTFTDAGGPVYNAVQTYNYNNPTSIINEDAPIMSSDSNFDSNPKAADWNITNQEHIANYSDLATWLGRFNQHKSEIEKDLQAQAQTLEFTFYFEDTNKTDGGKTITELIPITVIPQVRSKMWYVGINPVKTKMNAGQVLLYSYRDSFINSYSLLKALGSLLTFHWSNLSGPVGMVKSSSVFLESNTSKTESFSIYLRWASLISANLFLLNMIPFPPLDGWKFVENIYEGTTRRKINTKWKLAITLVGVVLLLILIVGITIKDIIGL